MIDRDIYGRWVTNPVPDDVLAPAVKESGRYSTYWMTPAKEDETELGHAIRERDMVTSDLVRTREALRRLLQDDYRRICANPRDNPRYWNNPNRWEALEAIKCLPGRAWWTGYSDAVCDGSRSFRGGCDADQ